MVPPGTLEPRGGCGRSAVVRTDPAGDQPGLGEVTALFVHLSALVCQYFQMFQASWLGAGPGIQALPRGPLLLLVPERFSLARPGHRRGGVGAASPAACLCSHSAPGALGWRVGLRDALLQLLGP